MGAFLSIKYLEGYQSYGADTNDGALTDKRTLEILEGITKIPCHFMWHAQKEIISQSD